MFTDVGAVFPPYIVARDAPGQGEGIMGAMESPEDTSSFDWECVLKCGEMPGYTVRRPGDHKGTKWQDDLAPTVPVTMLPHHLLRSDDWEVLLHGRWLLGDHVTLGESRAVVTLLKRLAMFPKLHRCVIASLQDNAPTACSMKKGCSASFALLRVLRQKAATSLVCSFQLLLPWVQSAVQPADEASR